MKRKVGVLGALAVAAAILLAGLASVAVGLFVLGVPWLARLYPYFAPADWSTEDTTDTKVTARTDEGGHEARLLSAFFGIDNGMPPIARFFICPFSHGQDGMPVIFSHELDVASVQAADFRVVSQAGEVGSVACSTFLAANDLGELRTVLLVGEFGSASDQPVTVEVIGDILSMDGSVNFKGAQVDVVPLEDGPSITLAETVPEPEWREGATATRLPWGGGSGCPAGTRLAVRVTWEGGVTKPDGSDADEEDLQRYEVVFAEPGDGSGPVPTALGDLGDGDNNHLLCFDAEGAPTEVRFPAGYLTDPRDDLNPETSAPIGR